ncbi:MAG TPA: hypothetical protein VFE62_27565 [Gemmataceae bacterium]|nr:hypothetical protein [Gemmataceae bacterium]
MRLIIVAFFSLAVLLAVHENVHAGLIGQTIKAEFIGGVDPGQYQYFTGVVPGSFTFNFLVHSVNYGDLFTVAIGDSTITITDVNPQAFIWEPGDRFVFTDLSGNGIANASFLSSTFPGFNSSNVTYTPNTITLSTPPGALLTDGDSLTIRVQSVPEPASMVLWGSVLTVVAGMLFLRLRRERLADAAIMTNHSVS